LDPSAELSDRSLLSGRQRANSAVSDAVSVTPKQFITGQFALWWIPIAMTDGRRPDFNQEGTYLRVWLTPERLTLEILYFPQVLNRDGPAEDQEPDTWILINGQFASYGRVLYDKAN
jgi:hypothetical protein